LGFLDYCTNPYARVGTRSTGNGAGSMLVTGSGWHAEIPTDFRASGWHLRSAKDWNWIVGRILVDGPADVALASNSMPLTPDTTPSPATTLASRCAYLTAPESTASINVASLFLGLLSRDETTRASINSST